MLYIIFSYINHCLIMNYHNYKINLNVNAVILLQLASILLETTDNLVGN